MASVENLLQRMRYEVPPGRERLSGRDIDRLTVLTGDLLRQKPDSDRELARYLSIRDRTIAVPEAPVRSAVRNRRILVTGGSGCLGTVLLRQLSDLHPAELTSVAVTDPEDPVPGVRYRHLDVRDGERVRAALRESRPDIVFHLAAQREPGLAELEAAKTVHVNVLGTRNVAEAAEASGVDTLVYASTGKALRPYTGDVYAASKRMGEWVVSRVAARGLMRCAAVRFTHVVDNSIVLRRFRRWARSGPAVRLHSPDTMFYAQSAVESAQLMLAAMTEPAEAGPDLRLFAIRDLGWPVSLLDLALGVIAAEGATVPLYIAGHDPGYEAVAYPGLYDPRLAGDVSPLLNGMEAHDARPAASPAVDAVPVGPISSTDLSERLAAVERSCLAGNEQAVRTAFAVAAWSVFTATVQAAPQSVLRRTLRLTESQRSGMTAEHLRMDEVFRRFARPAEEPVGAGRHPLVAHR